MTVLDFGCGPGFFTLEAAQLVGATGRIHAMDLQAGMLQRLRAKLDGTELQARVTLRQCEQHALGLSLTVDFVLAIYVLHELPQQHPFFAEAQSLLGSGGHLLIVEPIIHVSKRAFAATLERAQQAGFVLLERPHVRFSRAALLQKI
jgi:ubiquinone/menaquinone biosynthesis C-methylase UbiE